MPKTKKNIITAKNIVREFKNGLEITKVLKGISLDVAEGEMVAITGKSGSGKSTLLYQLGLLDYPNDGQITIDGQDTSNMSNKERTTFRLNQLGYVFQSYALLPSLTALDNVLIPLLMQGIDKAEAIERASKALTEVELGERLHYWPSQLSGGQQQRVSIARAVANQPKIIFADEPTANLDSEISKLILDLFLKINKQGQTIVLVTHEEKYAKKAHRRLIMQDGKWKK